MKTLKLLIAISIFSIISCSKSDDGNTAPAKFLLTKEITVDYTNIYTYDSSNKLTTITKQGKVDRIPTLKSALFSFSYNSDNTLKEIIKEYIETNNNVTTYRSFNTYENGVLKQINNSKKNIATTLFEIIQTDQFVYVSDNILDVNTFRTSGTNYRTRYTLSNKNKTQIDQYDNITTNNTQGTYSFTGVYSNFDNKNYIYASLPKDFEPSEYAFVNNHTKYQAGNYMETFTFEYNADNNVTKKTDNLGYVTNYEYTKI